MKNLFLISFIALIGLINFASCRDHDGGGQNAFLPSPANDTARFDTASSKSNLIGTTMKDPQVGSEMYCINTTVIVDTYFSNGNVYIINGIDSTHNTSFLVTRAALNGTAMTISNGMKLFVQDHSGLCPDNCDITKLIASISPQIFSYNGQTTSVPAPNGSTQTTNIDTFIATFLTSMHKNVILLNNALISNVYREGGTQLSMVLVYVYLVNGGDQIIYQGFDKNSIPCTGVYVDNTLNNVSQNVKIAGGT